MAMASDMAKYNWARQALDMAGMNSPDFVVQHESDPESLRRMIEMRMRWPKSAPIPLGALHAVKESERVVVLVVNKDQDPVTLVDDWAMFPSDRLVTQLRLLETK